MVVLEKTTNALVNKNDSTKSDRYIASALSEIDKMLSENLEKK
jgi:hypothetical protein